MKDSDVAIIGGGITGLSAAWELTRSASRPRITVFEPAKVGGKLQSSPFAGIDHVGIGSDFDGIGCTPDGLDDVSKFPSLTRALLEKGYKAEDIKKIYGGNTLRLLRAVEQAKGK